MGGRGVEGKGVGEEGNGEGEQARYNGAAQGKNSCVEAG